MKRILIISTLAALLVLPLIFTGCGDDVTLTESDIATIRGFGARLDSHDQSIATINTTLNGLDTDALGKLADLDADELAALLDLDLSTTKDDVTQLKTDMADLKDVNKDGSLADLAARVGVLENGGAGGSGGGSSISGEVTAILDVDADPLQFTSGTTATSQVFPVRIANGTSKYQKVTFNITLRCVSADYKADVAGGFTMTVNAVPFTATPVPALLNCQYIYFLWSASDSILVAPGKEVAVYVTLNNFATAVNYELWEVTLTGVTVTAL